MLAVRRNVYRADLTYSSPTLIYSTQTHTHPISAQCTDVLTFRANAHSRMRGISFFLASFCFLCTVAKLVSPQFQKRSPSSYLEDASEDAPYLPCLRHCRLRRVTCCQARPGPVKPLRHSHSFRKVGGSSGPHGGAPECPLTHSDRRHMNYRSPGYHWR